VAYGKAFVNSLREHGVSGAGILRPLIDDLNARAAMSPFDKATAALSRPANAQDIPELGRGPVVAMPNGDLIVTPRMVAKEGPVLIAQARRAVVLRGTAASICSTRRSYVISNVIEGKWPAKGNVDRSIGMKCRRKPGAVDEFGRNVSAPDTIRTCDLCLRRAG